MVKNVVKKSNYKQTTFDKRNANKLPIKYFRNLKSRFKQPERKLLNVSFEIYYKFKIKKMLKVI